MIKLNCDRCGFIEEANSRKIYETERMPYGDGYVERTGYLIECRFCGSDNVEELHIDLPFCVACEE